MLTRCERTEATHPRTPDSFVRSWLGQKEGVHVSYHKLPSRRRHRDASFCKPGVICKSKHAAPYIHVSSCSSCHRWCSGDVLECNALMDHKALKRAKTATNFLQTGAKSSQTVSRAALSHGIYGIPVFCCSQNGWRLKVTHKPVSVCHAVGAPRACSQHFLAASSEHFSPSRARYMCIAAMWLGLRRVGARVGSGRCSWVRLPHSCLVCELLGGAYLPC